MDSSTFWRGRRTLVLGCTGFLGTHVVRELLRFGAQVTGLIRDSQRPSEFFADRFHRKIQVVRGPADPLRLRSLIAVHQPEIVFQLASVSGQATAKHQITLEFLRTVSRLDPTLPIVVPVSPDDGMIRFHNHPLSRLRVGFVKLHSLFGPGDTTERAWAAKLFTAAATGRLVIPSDSDEPLTSVDEAVESLLSAAERLTERLDAPSEGLWTEAPITTTKRELSRRLLRTDDQPHDSLTPFITTTLQWYQRHARPHSVPLRVAA